MKKYLLITILGVVFVACTAKKAVTESTDNKNSVSLEAPIIPLTAELAHGKTIFETKCGRCHDLVKPESYSKEKWTPIMNSMAKKAKISDEEKALVYNYVTMNL
ncbi:MAG: cytochrome c5 [Flavobacterium sp.]|jgi:cytochrome c5